MFPRVANNIFEHITKWKEEYFEGKPACREGEDIVPALIGLLFDDDGVFKVLWSISAVYLA